MEKCYTDVTEFAIPASSQKLYLSPVLDGFNSEIIAYNLSTSPNLAQVKMMLEQAFTEKCYEKTILHSDQGWHCLLYTSVLSVLLYGLVLGFALIRLILSKIG